MKIGVLCRWQEGARPCVMPLRWTQVTDHSAVAFKQVLQTLSSQPFRLTQRHENWGEPHKKRRWNQHWIFNVTEKDIKPQNYLQNIWGNMRQTATQPIRSIGFSLAISRHFLIATLPGTNELPLNMDGWNTSLSEKAFQLFFRGKLWVSAREKNASQPLKIELGYPTLCVIELSNTHHPKEPKNIESPKHVPKQQVSKHCFTTTSYQFSFNPSPAIPLS